MRHVSESRASDILLRNHRSNVCHGDKSMNSYNHRPLFRAPRVHRPRWCGHAADGVVTVAWPGVRWRRAGEHSRPIGHVADRWCACPPHCDSSAKLGFEGRRELPAFGLVGNQACRREPLGSRSRQTPRGVGEDARAGRSRCCDAVVATKTVVVAVLTDGRAVSWSFLWRSNNQLATEFESFLKIGVRPPDPYYSDNG